MKYFHTLAFPYFRRHLEAVININSDIWTDSLVVEAVDLGDLPTLMVPSQDGDPAAEPHLQGHQQGHGLHAVVASVHVVPHEEIIGVRRLSCMVNVSQQSLNLVQTHPLS